MRIISWNIRHGGGTRTAGILRCVAGYKPDVLVLVEFQQGNGGTEIRAALAHLGMTVQTVAPAEPKQNSVLIASRQPFATLALPGVGEGDAHRVIGARFDDLDVFGFYFANGEKKTSLWQSILAATPTLLARPVLMVGDFNTGRHRADEKGATFWCAEHFEAMLVAGMIDGWRHFHGEVSEGTWFSTYGNGFRLDHAFVSPKLLARLASVDYSHSERESRISDHSMVLVELS